MSLEIGTLSGRSRVGLVLVALGVLLLIVPSLAPVQPVLHHESRASTMENGTMLEQQGYTVVAYENLSPRAQELYVEALESDGQLTVPVGQGASEFPYPTETELGAFENWTERERAQSIVIDRGSAADLPPAHEQVEAAEYRARDEREGRERDDEATPSEEEIEQVRQQIARYDLIQTSTGEPPLNGLQHVVRMVTLLTGVVAIGTGGYLLSTH